jgi:protein-disulfide isomerase
VSEVAERRRPRIVGLLVIAVCVGLLGFAIVSLSVGTGSTGQIEITGATEIQSLLGGIPQDGSRLGSSDAPVSVQVFNDLQCDSCSDWNREVVVPLIREEVRPGHIQLTYHHFPMNESGFGLAAYGGVAAAKQDDEWQFIQLFFLNQDEAKRRTGGADQEFLDNIARAVLNFNVEQWQQDIASRAAIERTLDEDDRLAAERRFPARPAVVVGGPNGSVELSEAPSLADIQAAIRQVS